MLEIIKAKAEEHLLKLKFDEFNNKRDNLNSTQKTLEIPELTLAEADKIILEEVGRHLNNLKRREEELCKIGDTSYLQQRIYRLKQAIHHFKKYK